MAWRAISRVNGRQRLVVSGLSAHLKLGQAFAPVVNGATSSFATLRSCPVRQQQLFIHRQDRHLGTPSFSPHYPPLQSIVKLDLFMKEDAKTIEKIWLEYHMQHERTLSAVLSKDQFEKLNNRLCESPAFILPVPKEEGWEMWVMTKTDNMIGFADVEMVKQMGDSAPVCVSLVYYPDLLDSKGIVLMRGKVLDGIPMERAQFVSSQLQVYYFNDDNYQKYVRSFNENPKAFPLEELVAEIVGKQKSEQQS